jgi:cardiolipin synthase
MKLTVLTLLFSVIFSAASMVEASNTPPPETPALARVQQPEHPGDSAKPGLREKILATASISKHFIKSHSQSLLMRPIRSVGNLAFLAGSTATGLLRNLALDTFGFPRLDDEITPLPGSATGMDLSQWEQDLDKMTGTKRTRGSLDLLIDGEAFFDRLLEEIANANESIKFRTYIFDNDDHALRIADALKHRADDIEVDILVDGLGTLASSLSASSSLPKDFDAPDSIESYVEQDSNVDLHMLSNTWFMGDHTKTYLFDDKVAFLGGMNIGREYRYDWHDLMVELSGPVVDQLSRDTAMAAADRTFGDLALLQARPKAASGPVNEGAELRLLYTKPFSAQIYKTQLEAIRRSRSYIYIQNAYLSDDLVLYELVKARKRGVDVRVVVPSRPDSGLMERSNLLATNILKRHGVRVYQYPGMTHVKAAIYDGWACFGTANFDKLSFKLNKEVNIATSDPHIVSALKQRVFEVDFAISAETTDAQPSYVADYIYEQIVDVVL